MAGRWPRSQEKGAHHALLWGGWVAKVTFFTIRRASWLRVKSLEEREPGDRGGALLTTPLEQLGPTIDKTEYFYLAPKLPFLLKPACVWFLKPTQS